MQEEFNKLEEELRKDIKETGSQVVDGDMVTYRTIMYEGYLGDFATEWWTEEDWCKHNKHVEELKANGTYGKPWVCELTLKNIPEFDTPQDYKISNKSVESYSFTIIDLSK